MMLPSAPHISGPTETFRRKKFEGSDRRLTPSKHSYSSSFLQDTPPTKPRHIERTFLTEQGLDTRNQTQQEITPIKPTQITKREKSTALQGFEKILSNIDFTSGTKQIRKDVPVPQLPKASPCFVRRSNKKNSGIKSDEKAAGLSTTLDTSTEESKPNYKLQFSHCKEPKISEPRHEIRSFEVDGQDVPFRRRRFASVDLVLKKRKASVGRKENDKASRNYHLWSLNRIIREDSDEASTQRGKEIELPTENYGNDNDETAKEWRFVLSGSDLEAKVFEEYEKEMQNIDKEIVEFIRMGIARKGLLLNKLRSEHTKTEKSLSDELSRMKNVIESAVGSYCELEDSDITKTP